MASTHRRARSITSTVRGQEITGPTVLSVQVTAYQVRWRNVEERLATHPSEATQIDSDGRSVLYHALVRRIEDYPPFPIVRSILRAYPKAIWKRHNKTTLIELACSRLASLETLELLAQARPAIPEDSSALIALWQGYCQWFGDENFVVSFLESRTAEAFQVGCKFQLLLRYLTTEQLLPSRLPMAASSHHCSLELFKQFRRTFPEQLHHSFEGMLPLHLALLEAQGSPSQASKAMYLLQEMPESAHRRDPNGKLPLHLALEIGLVDETNVESWWGTEAQHVLGTPDLETGLFPFQMGALPSSNASVSIIYQLLRPAPYLVQTPVQIPSSQTRRPVEMSQNQGLEEVEWISPGLELLLGQVQANLWEELHRTLRHPVDPFWHQLIGAAQVFGCPLKLVKFLISMHPEKLQHPDSKGWLPLHHAVASPYGERREITSLILEAYPAAARHLDRWGRLPFHLACLTGKGCWLLDMLKPHNPKAILQPDGWLELPPVLLAAQSPRATVSNVFHLLISAPDVLIEQMTLD
jgi:hypothetical protein